jgi:hypothetical protein
MPIPQLSVGVPTSIAQNVVYALPTVLCFLSSSVAIEGSLDGTTWTALTGANTTGVYAGVAFVRCPTAAAIVNCET